MTTPEVKAPPSAEPQQAAPPEQEAPKEMPVVEEKATTVTPGQLAAQAAADASQQQAAPPPQPQVVTVTIPADPQQLQDWTKGDPENALTWFSFFWLRMLKKALYHGYHVVTEGAAQTQYA